MRNWRWLLQTIILLIMIILPIQTPTSSAQQPETITVSGRVERGTADGRALPQNMLIELRTVNVAAATSSAPLTTIANADGAFVFENVPRLQGNDFFLLFTSYDGFRQTTRPIFDAQAGFVVFLVYEVTTSTADLAVVGGYIQVDQFARIRERGTNLNIVMDLQIVNRGDRIVYNPATGYSLTFELPVGAVGIDEVVLDSADSEAVTRRLHIEDGIIPLVHETTALIPNWPVHNIQLQYLIPYPGEAVLDQPFPLRVDELEVLVPLDEVYVDGDAVIDTEEVRDIAPERPRYAVYTLSEPITAMHSLVFTLQGDPVADAIAGRRSGDDDSTNIQQLVVIFGSGLFLLFLIIVWWAMRSRRAALAELLEQTKPHD